MSPPPQVSLFLSNLRGEAETDAGLRAYCEQYGPLERCFVVRGRPAGRAAALHVRPLGAEHVAAASRLTLHLLTSLPSPQM